jgi:diguanylate cyclase (GGDEF)-like protein/PAS domain S-box-containing protein
MVDMLKRYSLSSSYWIAFFILGVWVTFAYFTMHTLIKSEQKYGTLINLSGKQRMLSQRTAFYAHLVVEHNAGTQHLISLIRMMKEDHAYIVSNLTTDKARDYYFKLGGLNAQVEAYMGLLSRFAADPGKAQLEAIMRGSIPLLSNLNEAVSIFENENNAVVSKLEQRELFIYFGTLLTLLLEALVIISPMIRLHKNHLAELEEEVKSRTKDTRIYANVFENTREGIIIADEHKHIINVNGAFTDITGYTDEEVLGKPMHIFKSDKHDKAFYKQMWHEIHTRDVWQGEVVNKKKDGREVYEHVTIMKLTDGESVNYVTVFSDISDRVYYEQKLHYLANHDSLTGLLNRSETLNRIDHAIALAERSNKSLAVVFIDLDNFKVINDSLGHVVGDRLLVEMSKRLSRTVRTSDTLGRLGGDEFVVLLESLSHEGDEKTLLEKLLALFEQPINIDGKELAVAASLGVIYYPEDDAASCTAECLVRKADMAMYRAKELGKNRIAYYNDELEDKIQSQMLVKNQLSEAIEHGELSLYLQPKINLADGRIRGAEALLQWHRDGAFIPPAKFIEIAEENDLIKQIDRWVLQETIKLVEKVHARGYGDFSIAMNMSGRTFSDPHVVEAMLGLVKASGMEGSIEFEITERVLIENLLFASNTIQKIRSAGVSVSLDDFGTGYSSFSYLSKMPLDAIKIDRSFIAGLHEPKQKILVEAMIAFSEKLGMRVIAEGIETEEQLAWLRAQQCDLGQGYLFSKPLPYEAFEKLLGSYRYEG